jgi:TatD DNase family protein
MYTDSHSHIQFSWKFPDVDKVIARAIDAGVTRQVIVGCTVKDSFQALNLVKKYDDKQFWCAFGIHPHDSNQCTEETLNKFKETIKKEQKVVAIGEIGLDFFRNLQLRETQVEAFKAQLRLAKELNLPAIIHVRDAWEDALQIIEEIGNEKVVMHCYTGSLETARKCWEKGFLTSFTGIVTYPKNDDLRVVASSVPEDLFMIETDCPYLPPQIYRGRRNEPAYVVETARVIGEERGCSAEEIGEITTQNAIRFFALK